MTLLKAKDILHISENLQDYNELLLSRFGKSLAEIAMCAVGKNKKDFEDCYRQALIAVVPVTAGNGIINGFSDTVKAIIENAGFKCFVTQNKDITGLEEAYNKQARVIFIADDDKFIAINTCSNKIADNSIDTGKGYAAALDLMSGGLKDKSVVLIGAGPVGMGAASYMTAHGAKVLVYDILKQKAKNLKLELPEIGVLSELDNALKNNDLIFDATPAIRIIRKEHINDKTLISAPGIPLGLEEDCIPIIKDRLMHDVLELGVVTMLFDALC